METPMSLTANPEMTRAASAVTEAAAPGPDISIMQDPWGAWFAWHPVKLYMTRRYCWLRTIHRRCVTKNGLQSCEYTDQPEEYPSVDASEHKQ